jgi:hypothetical protein
MRADGARVRPHFDVEAVGIEPARGGIIPNHDLGALVAYMKTLK